MKASELISELQNLMNEHGDLPVHFCGGSCDYSVDDVIAYNKDGNYPSADEPAAEFYIHEGSRASLSTPHTPTGE